MCVCKCTGSSSAAGGRWIQEKRSSAWRQNREQIIEMSGVVGHIRTHAVKQNEFNTSNNHKLCVCGGLGHSDSDHMWMQLCV